MQEIQGRIIYGHPVDYKEYRTIATQTEDNVSNNGCMSMYINRHTSYALNISDATSQQRPGGTVEERTITIEPNVVNAIKLEPKDEQEHDESSKHLPVENSYGDDDYDHRKTTWRNNHDQVDQLTQEEISEMLRVLEEMDFSSGSNLVPKINSEDKSLGENDKIMVDFDNEDSVDVGNVASCIYVGSDDDVEDGDDRDVDDANVSEDNDDDDEEFHYDIDGKNVEYYQRDLLDVSNKIQEGTDGRTKEQEPHQIAQTICILDNTQESHNIEFVDNQIQLNEGIQSHQDGNYQRTIENDVDLTGERQHDIKMNTDPQNHQSSVCNQLLKRNVSPKSRFIEHSGMINVECTDCKKKFKTKTSLNIHLSMHTGKKLHKCSYCSKIFTKKSILTCHIRSHTKEKVFQCSVCKKGFSLKGNLKRHMKIHSSEKPFECSVCKKEFMRKEILKDHMKIHTGEKPFKCSLCKKDFNRRSSLKEHIKIHLGKKPFECSVCKNAFIRKDQLVIHMRGHTGEKPFKCSVCKKGFRRKDNLKGHIKIHTGEKPFECSVCRKGFRLKGHMKEHMKIHTGEKPFECSVCKKGFTHKCNLKKHMKIHTGEK